MLFVFVVDLSLSLSLTVARKNWKAAPGYCVSSYFADLMHCGDVGFLRDMARHLRSINVSWTFNAQACMNCFFACVGLWLARGYNSKWKLQGWKHDHEKGFQVPRRLGWVSRWLVYWAERLVLAAPRQRGRINAGSLHPWHWSPNCWLSAFEGQSVGYQDLAALHVRQGRVISGS